MMPKPSIWMIRLSLIYFLISAILGGLILSEKVIDLHPMVWSLLPVHYELAVWGWLVQFILGTAYWMFPKKLEGERRGKPLPAWIMIILLNTGILLLISSNFAGNVTETLSLSGRSLITLSILIFTSLIWNRVVTYRKSGH